MCVQGKQYHEKLSKILLTADNVANIITHIHKNVLQVYLKCTYGEML